MLLRVKKKMIHFFMIYCLLETKQMIQIFLLINYVNYLEVYIIPSLALFFD